MHSKLNFCFIKHHEWHHIYGAFALYPNGIQFKIICQLCTFCGFESYVKSRAVGRSENPRVPVVIRWALSVLLVDIGLTSLPKFGCASAMAHRAFPGTIPLQGYRHEYNLSVLKKYRPSYY